MSKLSDLELNGIKLDKNASDCLEEARVIIVSVSRDSDMESIMEEAGEIGDKYGIGVIGVNDGSISTLTDKDLEKVDLVSKKKFDTVSNELFRILKELKTLRDRIKDQMGEEVLEEGEEELPN